MWDSVTSLGDIFQTATADENKIEPSCKTSSVIMPRIGSSTGSNAGRVENLLQPCVEVARDDMSLFQPLADSRDECRTCKQTLMETAERLQV